MPHVARLLSNYLTASLPLTHICMLRHNSEVLSGMQLAGLVLGQLQSAEAWHKSVLAALLIRRVRPAQVRVRVRACVCSLHTSVRANAVDCLPLSGCTALIFINNLNAAPPLSSI